tara:strand:- start:7249 stop:7467 length:219 start_codon:yes stop_codon:yes gene_type:complete
MQQTPLDTYLLITSQSQWEAIQSLLAILLSLSLVISTAVTLLLLLELQNQTIGMDANIRARLTARLRQWKVG